MPFLVAVAGLSGSGKTTFIDHLETLGAGTKVYLGQIVHDAIRAKGLKPTPANEKMVRFELRAKHGPGALATIALPKIRELLVAGISVFVDAIFTIEEHQILRACDEICVAKLVAIQAPFEMRAMRLRSRSVRPLTEQELRDRDAAELIRLKMESVLDLASHTLQNEGSEDEFKKQAELFWKKLLTD
jgi:dephospho-CoA kinase